VALTFSPLPYGGFALVGAVQVVVVVGLRMIAHNRGEAADAG
jgi:hypothetical protein